MPVPPKASVASWISAPVTPPCMFVMVFVMEHDAFICAEAQMVQL